MALSRSQCLGARWLGVGKADKIEHSHHTKYPMICVIPKAKCEFIPSLLTRLPRLILGVALKWADEPAVRVYTHGSAILPIGVYLGSKRCQVHR